MRRHVPYVSKRELKEIKNRFGTPQEYNEGNFVDMTDWIKKNSKENQFIKIKSD